MALEHVYSVLKLHERIAHETFPRGVRLRCRRCGKRKKEDRDEAAHYLRCGWPMCCGETMILETNIEGCPTCTAHARMAFGRK